MLSGGGGGGGSGGGDSAELPRSIKAFDSYVVESVDPFVDVCNKLGGDAAKLGKLLVKHHSIIHILPCY